MADETQFAFTADWRLENEVPGSIHLASRKDCWMGNVPMPVSVWHTADNERIPVTAICPNAVLVPLHASLNWDNRKILFVLPDGSYYVVNTRGTNALTQLGTSDLGLVLTNTMPQMNYPKFFTTGWDSHFTNNGQGQPMVIIDQKRRAQVANAVTLMNTSGESSYVQPPTTQPYRRSRYIGLVDGDSGGPHFLTWGNDLILHAITYGPSTGTVVAPHTAQINSILTSDDSELVTLFDWNQ